MKEIWYEPDCDERADRLGLDSPHRYMDRIMYLCADLTDEVEAYESPYDVWLKQAAETLINLVKKTPRLKE